MANDPVKMSSWVQRLWNAVDVASIVFGGYVSGTTTNIRMSIVELKKMILGNKTVGGTAAGDIADIDSAQSFSNKNFPTGELRVNNTALTPTPAEFNKLAGLTPSTTELNRIAGLSSPVQNQLGAKTERLANNEPYPISLYSEFTTVLNTSESISVGDLKYRSTNESNVNFSALSKKLSSMGVVVQVYKINSTTELMLDTDVNVKVTRANDALNNYNISSINLSGLATATDYIVSVTAYIVYGSIA